jgi:hypothetical protein
LAGGQLEVIPPQRGTISLALRRPVSRSLHGFHMPKVQPKGAIEAEGADRIVVHRAAEEVELLLCTVNYAEALVRPAQDERNLRAASDAIASLGIRLLARATRVSPPSTSAFAGF